MAGMEKTILAIDAALGPCSVAVLKGTQTLAEAHEERPKEQSRQLVAMIESALRAAGLEYAGLDAIVSTVGPGTFTGLRIGLAAARGIGFATKKPVHGVTTLTATALAATRLPPADRQVAGKQAILAVLNAGKGEAYFQLFSAGLAPLSEASLAPPEQLPHPEALLAGNIPPDWVKGRPFLPLMPGALAAGLAFALVPGQIMPPEPFYIRPPDAKPPA